MTESGLTNDLTVERLERIIANHESGVQLTGVHMYWQLLATMRREAKMREALDYVLAAGRGSSGRIILDQHQEEYIRDAMAVNQEARSEYSVKD